MNDARRKSELAVIHIAKKELGLDEEIYRDIVRRISGIFRLRGEAVSSAAEMTARERAAMLDELHRLGFRAPIKRKPPAPGSRQEEKIRELWRILNNCGALHDASEKALQAFIKRQTHGAQIIPRWLTAEQANAVIEGLKAWHRRVESPAKARATSEAALSRGTSAASREPEQSGGERISEGRLSEAASAASPGAERSGVEGIKNGGGCGEDTGDAAPD